MSTHNNKIVTRTQQSQPSKSRMRVSRLEQQIDDMRVVIQSSVPVSTHAYDHHHRNHRQLYESSKYYIHIDQDDGSNIDLTVKLGAKSQNMQPRPNGRYLTEQASSRHTSNNYNQGANQGTSQVRNQQFNQTLYETSLGKTQNLSASLKQRMSYGNQLRDQVGQTTPKQNRVTTTETRHIIRIIDGHYDSNKYQKVPSPNRAEVYAAPSHEQQRYYSNYANEDNKGENSAGYKSQNMKHSFKRQREQKSFANANSETRGKEGRIMRNGDSKKNITEQQEHLHYSKNRQLTNDKAQQIPYNQQKIPKQSREIEDYIPQSKKFGIQKANKNQTTQQDKQNNIKYFNKNQKGNYNTNAQQIGDKPIQQNEFNTTKKQQMKKNMKTPAKNYLNSTIADSRYDQLSPIVYPYRNDQIPDYDDVGPVFIEDNKSPKRKKIFNQNNHLNKRNSIDDDFDRQRRAPFPYEAETTLEKSIQKQILNQPPSVTQIPFGLPNKKIKANDQYYSSRNQKRVSDSPIVVPISRLPRGSSKKHEMNLLTQRQSRHEGGGLNKYMRDRTRTQMQGDEVTQQADIFTINKRKYLDKLRREQKSRSRLQQSRTLSRRSKPTLSPEVSRITNRLYGTPVNKQPCPKFVRDQERMERIQMKQTLGEYTFIRRYLSDKQIYEILAQFQNVGVPERKWPMKLVDIVYDKLKAMKSY